VGPGHPLLGAAVLAAVEHAASAHRGRRWVSQGFVSTAAGAVVIDPAPCFGHPEADLALVDYFQPVPDELFRAYRDITPVDRGFTGRRELWRLPAYLAVIAVDGEGLYGRRYLARLTAAVRSYR
jgi:fructosamine-3-kinase